MKSCLVLFLSMMFPFLIVHGQDRDQKIQLFPLEDVELLNSPFKHAMDLNKEYLLSLDPDRLLAPYLREANLEPKTKSYTNWENTGLDGHIGGHYVSALSLMYASSKDKEIKARLDYMLSEFKRCQDALGTGYIGGVPGSKELWNEIKHGNIEAGNFDLNKKWVPLYNIHKVYAGLRDAYLFAHDDTAKEMLIKMTDWAVDLVSNLSDAQIQDMLRSEYGGLNEVFADVAVISGNEKYLKLANQFTQNVILDPLLKHKDELTGLHANTQIPKIIGAKRIAEIQNKDEWNSASRFFWETVVENRTVSIGGNSAYEHFHPSNDFSKMITSVEGPETCNTYNMLKLSVQLFLDEGLSKYVDYYERALYNHILSTQHPVHGGFVYFTPMRPEHYRVYSQPQTSFWCCVGSGLENHSKYAEFIYAHKKDDLYVNLFIPSNLKWEEKAIEIIQENNFPNAAATKFRINSKKKAKFNLKIRYPKWVKDGDLKVQVNGRDMKIAGAPGEYFSIERDWQNGDIVEVKFGMHVSVEQLPDNSNYYSFLYGPIVLAAKNGTEDLKGMLADDSRGGHIACGKQVPLQDVPVIIAREEQLETLPELISPRELRFKLNNLYHNTELQNEELEPFYKVHDARYTIYWPQANSLEDYQSQFDNKAYLSLNLLDSISLDRVSCGQQQPESDHQIDYKDSRTGIQNNLQWRDAKGYFGYDLKNRNKTAKVLYVQFFHPDGPSEFDVELNGSIIASFKLVGDIKNLETKQIEIPDNIQASEIIKVRFVAKNNTVTPKFTEIRILNSKLK